MTILIGTVIPSMQPDSLDWSRPEYGTTGNGLPVTGPYWTCRLGFPRVTTLHYEEWFRILGTSTTVYLPHPRTGVLTEFTDVVIRSLDMRMDVRGRKSAANGVDIVISRIMAT